MVVAVKEISFFHMIDCFNFQIPIPTEDKDPTIASLKNLAKMASQNGGTRPAPFQEPTGQHLELDVLDEPESEVEMEELEFD